MLLSAEKSLVEEDLDGKADSILSSECLTSVPELTEEHLDAMLQGESDNQPAIKRRRLLGYRKVTRKLLKIFDSKMYYKISSEVFKLPRD